MDFPLRQKCSDRHEAAKECFNPCCSGFSVKTGEREGSRRYQEFVSILVVVDFPLRQIGIDSKRVSKLGFNPCCSGFSVKTIYHRWICLSMTMFQSLL